MSLVTTCPACQTRFLVLPEQLAVRQGQVQCGHCQHIFNALEALQEIPVGDAAQAKHEASLDHSPIDGSVSAEALPQTLDTASVHDIGQSQEQDAEQALDPSLDPSLMDQASASETITTDITQGEASEATRQPDASPEISMISAESPADLQAEAFLNAKAKRKTPLWLKCLQAVLLLLLLLLALAQVAYFERSLLAAYVPEARHWLNLACAKLQCTVGLPKHPENLTIEDQDMLESAEQAGLIRLSSTLINNGAYALEYPMITLELLDANEHPLVRRDFSPAQYLDKEIAIAAGIPAGGEVSVHLLFKTEAQQVSGFKIRVHY